MDDRLRETLSAMMDDEADELSVRRLLSHGEQSDVRSQWQRWQQVRDVMHQRQVLEDVIDVSVGVRRVIESGETTGFENRTVEIRPSRSWHWPAAAMVSLALIVGFGVGAGWDSSEPEAQVAGGLSTGAPEISDTVDNKVQEVALQGLDEEQWEHLSRYLLEHAQHNSVGAGRGSVGYARLVTASTPSY
ncbi:sigma-E factor negative regulatory protein [uncultured Marinobacter sp.]|uniref:sigma-E factor negative regulatory protein n=1 Tax=uncultured Marinobacter sp. TaxID=187379 RepID=UPI0026187FD2|nr:sigma-E factor negative regulatory protein [uncultured Marinobacter sp.]